MLGLRFCARAFSSCGKRGPLFIAMRGPLTVAASLVAEHRIQTRRLSSCGSRAQPLCGMWDLPRPGLEHVSPALAGRFSTTAPPGKPLFIFYFFLFFDFFFKLYNFYLFIYLFMAELGLRFCARALSSCGKRGPLFITVRGPLTIAASLVVEHRLQTRRLSNCGSRAQLLHGIWDPPRPGLEPVSPALAGRLPTTAPPGKPRFCLFFKQKNSKIFYFVHF